MQFQTLMPAAAFDDRQSQAVVRPRRRGVAHVLAVPASVVLLCTIIGGVVHYWPERLDLPIPALLQKVQLSNEDCVVYISGDSLVGNLADFNDGFFAFLMFDYYRSRRALAQKQVMLTSEEQGQTTVYRISVRLPDDFLAGIEELAQLHADHLTAKPEYAWIPQDELKRDLHQTTLFLESYGGPTQENFKRLHEDELRRYVRTFIRFKSMTDPRIHQASGPIPSPLTRQEASRLAADIIAVAQFYSLPLDLLIGIGAMENNFMDVPGDTENTTWKRRAEPGDVVLKRRRGRILVKNDSSGIWQITRESLRYAHHLYLSDKRDYSQLPERLRPPEHLDMGNVSQDALTTYAGLLLRDLLDRFQGDVTRAAGAYNGTVSNPNEHYAAGVETVAQYARRTIERAAELNHEALAENSIDRAVVDRKPQ